MHRSTLAFIFLSALFTAAAAGAQSLEENLNACNAGKPDQAIGGCTSVNAGVKLHQLAGVKMHQSEVRAEPWARGSCRGSARWDLPLASTVNAVGRSGLVTPAKSLFRLF